MKSADIPSEVRSWLLHQAESEPFAIYVDSPRSLTVVTGGDLPLLLWEKYRSGNLKAFLDSMNYEEKERPDEKTFFTNMVKRCLCMDVDEDVTYPPQKFRG